MHGKNYVVNLSITLLFTYTGGTHHFSVHFNSLLAFFHFINLYLYFTYTIYNIKYSILSNQDNEKAEEKRRKFGKMKKKS